MQRSLVSFSESADRDLERRVVSYLADRHVPALRHLDVEAENGTVTIRGQVRSFYEKQLCHLCCQRVAGVRRLIDAVEVTSASELVGAVA